MQALDMRREKIVSQPTPAKKTVSSAWRRYSLEMGMQALDMRREKIVSQPTPAKQTVSSACNKRKCGSDG
jgi:hypothetical protein